jgi:catechol 2,3-dioxygenase
MKESNMTGKLPDQTELGIARLRVADLGRSLAFYHELVGFDVMGRSGATALLGAGGAPLLHLEAHAGLAPRPRSATGLFHIALLLPSRADLGAMLRRLIEKSVPLGASDHIVSEALYLDDPDDNGLEIYADRPRASWSWEGGEIAMATEPLDARGLVADAAPAQEPYHLPQGTRIGHIHLQVGDLATARRFYVDILGMEVTTQSYPGALFVSAGGYHHHLGLNVWRSRGLGAAPENAAGLDAFELRLPAETDLAPVRRRLEEAGVDLVEDQRGFTVRDPWANRIAVRSA